MKMSKVTLWNEETLYVYGNVIKAINDARANGDDTAVYQGAMAEPRDDDESVFDQVKGEECIFCLSHVVCVRVFKVHTVEEEDADDTEDESDVEEDEDDEEEEECDVDAPLPL